eukprot:TRINITY_DN30347_c0_g1_i1.p1 TRINITY_DN30347_c0_g1~~TRINITY_DN30347_c0_g1_i1.p1  ORF type:complete len:240 (+),score=37.54 TRINITY_DN30347_c0_g1_i1:56-775(+)
MEYVERSEYEALERRLIRAEQSLRTQDAQIKLLQARFDAIAMPPQHMSSMCRPPLVIAPSTAPLRDRSRSPLPLPLIRGVATHMQQPTISKPAVVRQHQGTKIMSAEEFATMNDLDSKCSEALFNQPAEVQEYVIGMGPADGRNPSAMVMARIAKCTSEFSMGPGGHNTISAGLLQDLEIEERVEDFICDNSLDKKCADALRTQTPECQAAVISLGPAEGRNSSAMVVGRIAKFVRGEL